MIKSDRICRYSQMINTHEKAEIRQPCDLDLWPSVLQCLSLMALHTSYGMFLSCMSIIQFWGHVARPHDFQRDVTSKPGYAAEAGGVT